MFLTYTKYRMNSKRNKEKLLKTKKETKGNQRKMKTKKKTEAKIPKE